jgi:hypothetical protein
VSYGDRLNKFITVSNVVLNTGPRSAELFAEAKTNLDQSKIYYPITTGCDVVQWVCYKYEFTDLYRAKGDISFKSSNSITSLQRIALNQFINNNQTETFRSIRNPTMGIQGELDTTAPVSNLIVLSNLISDFRWQIFKKAGHAVTDEYIDYLIMSIQAFLSDIGTDSEWNGLFPVQDWFWLPYRDGGRCLNPILNCNPERDGGPLPVEAPTTNGRGFLGVLDKLPRDIVRSGSSVSELKKAIRG